jgi:PAS domain S-box-containing protein
MANRDSDITARRQDEEQRKSLNESLEAGVDERTAELENAIQKLRESGEQIRGIVETAVDAIVTIDEKGIVQSVNPAVERLFGYSSDEVVGQNVSMLAPSPFREEHDDYIGNYLSTGEKKIIGIGREIVGQRKDGSKFPVHLAVSEVQLPGRRLFTGIVRDISDLKQAEQELRDSEQRYRCLVETAGVVIVSLTPEHRIVQWNREAERVFGWSRDEVLGRNYVEMFLPDEVHDDVIAEIRKNLDGQPTRGYENTVVSRDGTRRILLWDATRLVNESGEPSGIVAVGQDITERKKAQDRALQAERLAAIGQMVTGLAHESRNAIQRAQACQEMLALDLQDQPELLDFSQRTQQALDDLHRLYEEVRGYGTPFKLEPETCDLADLWRKTWSHLEVARRGRNVRLREETGNVDLQCRVDLLHVEQVFRNILENALDACPEPGEVVVKCAETELNGMPALQIALCDNGPGLTIEQAKNIFEPFFSTKKKGTGLGMAIAKQFVEAHGGRIEVGNSDRPGAEIVVKLPREPM